MSESGSRHYLAGTLVDNWFAINRTHDLTTGLPGRTRENIADYLETGRATRNAAFGAMAQVVDISTQHLRDDERAAISDYLKSLPHALSEGTALSLVTSESATGGHVCLRFFDMRLPRR